MPRPGVNIALRNTPSVVSVPIITGTAFVAGTSDRGPITPTLIGSLNDFINVYGARQSYSSLYDWLELYFREGGNRAYISRVVGPNPTTGFKNLLDAGAGISLVVNGIGPGAWSANYKVAVIAGVAGGAFQIQVLDTNNVVLENSPDLFTQLDAIQWSQSSAYVRITLGATALIPVVMAAAVLSAGTDDRVNIVDAQWATAYGRFTSDLGPGQVVGIGRTTTVGQQQLITHAEANNRVALIDLTDSGTVGTLTAATAALTHSRFAEASAPWVVIPGITSGQSGRTVPSSALLAGLIARNDASGGPNLPSAGNAGVSRYCIGLSQTVPWTDTERTTLNVGGVNIIRSMFNGIRVYGWRSFANPTTDADWLDFGNGRLYMSLSAELDLVGENYVFDEIDGQFGSTIGGFHTALAGVLLGHFNRGELFGSTADQAFSVDTGPTVNTLTTIANLELHGVCAVKMAPMAEWVSIEIVKVPVSAVL